MLSSDEDWGVGSTALYSCEEGFHVTGQSELVCGEDNGVVEWKGEIPICKKLGTTCIYTRHHCFIVSPFHHK